MSKTAILTKYEWAERETALDPSMLDADANAITALAEKVHSHSVTGHVIKLGATGSIISSVGIVGPHPSVAHAPIAMSYSLMDPTGRSWFLTITGGQRDVTSEKQVWERMIRDLPDKRDDLAHLFHIAAAQWRNDTRSLSSPIESSMHPSYQEIIGFGQAVLPFILQDLAETHDHWFWALRAIAREDPTEPGDNVEQAAQAWLRWGREKGYLK